MTTQIKLLIDDKKRKRKRGTVKVKRGVRQLFPGRIEREYTAYLNKLVSVLIAQTKDHILPELPAIVEEAGLARPNSDGLFFSLTKKIKSVFNRDDFSDRISNAVLNARVGIEGEYTAGELESITQTIANETSDFNRKEVTKVLKRMIDVNVFFEEPWLDQEVNAFIKQNIDLIKTIPDKHFKDIQGMIYRGARQGIRHEEIQKEIMGTYKKTRNIAKRIARDQVNKFNGQLTKLRQESLGIDKYRWNTVGDERVRGTPGGRSPDAKPSHYDRDGKTYEWENPPVGGHPGEPILCRCWGEPILDAFL